MQSIDVKLKVVNANIVKRIPVPESFENLKSLASALIQNKQPKITYVDTDGDNVEVMDDSDLRLALSGSNKIVFQVAPFGELTMQSQASVQPRLEEIIDTTSAKVVNEEPTGKKGKKTGCPKDGNKGMNRKALKNLIQAELQSQSKEIFREILKAPIDGVEESKDSATTSKKLTVHNSVECDGCGMAPISGIRYKCSVCKDFDYCSNCEERLTHDHPFLKIKSPENVPDVMITILN